MIVVERVDGRRERFQLVDDRTGERLLSYPTLELAVRIADTANDYAAADA